MPHLELWFLALSFAGLILGCWGICWSRADHCGRVWWGRRLFVVTLLGLGASGLVAACAWADGLVSLGLLAGLLMVAMLWEGPAGNWDHLPLPVNEGVPLR